MVAIRRELFSRHQDNPCPAGTISHLAARDLNVVCVHLVP
jgi:hypothetical protein